MSPHALGEYLGIELTRYSDENPARCALADYSGQYVEAAGQIIALNLYGRELTKAPSTWLSQLPALRYLNLAKCGLTTCDLREVSPELQVLFLQDNPDLTNLQLPDAFPALLRADLSHCGLDRVNWPASPVLEMLNLSRQQDKSLTHWTFATACPRLYYCDLSHNSLTNFHLPAGFVNLAYLCLENNQLRRVELAGELPGLESLRLSDNQLKTVPAAWLNAASNLLNLFLDKNEIEERYQTFIEGKSPHEVVTALRDVFLNEALGTAKNNECKVLLIGNGKAGKSCIVHRLKTGEFKADWDSTHGIELFSYPLEEWQVHFWDFGGQDIYHATHRLFMQSNVVYLLVWSKESDPRVNPTLATPQGDAVHHYRNYSLDYWLHYADLLGKHSPIILVQTHKAKGVEHTLLDIPLLDTLTPKPLIHQVESDWPAPENGYPELLRHIGQAVQRLKEAEGDRAATNILTMRHWLRQQKKKGKKVLPLDAYLAKATKLKINGARDVLASWLHKTGVLFYDAERTGERIILDQEWAIEAIYTLFDRNQAHFARIRANGGVFTAWELQQIWRNWPEADPELFLAFMLACEVCFEVPLGEQEPAQRSYLAPGLLRERQPAEEEAFWGGKPYWEVHYRFPVLHYGMVQQLLVKTHRFALLQRMTQTSTTLLHQGMEATIVAQRESEYLNHVVVRVGRNDFPLLASIEELLADLQPEPPERFLRDPDSQRLVSWQRLEAAFTHGIAQIECEDGHYLARELFADFYLGTVGDAAAGEDPEAVRSAGRKSAVAAGQARLPRVPFDPEAVAASGAPSILAPPPQPGAAEKTILFIAANPLGTAKLKLSDEFTAIYRELKDQSYYDFYPLKQPSMGQVVDAVFERKPHIIHFSGHGTDQAQKNALSQSLRVDSLETAGLIFMDEDVRQELVVKTEDLKRQFEDYLEEVPLELVVFNACHSHHYAKAISELGLTVVGTSSEIADQAAIVFASGLYRVLAKGGTLDQAVRRGVAKARPYRLDDTQVQVYRDGELIYGS